MLGYMDEPIANAPSQRDEPPHKISKLAIAAETEADRYDTKTEVRCYECNVEKVDPTSGKLPAIIEGVLKANTFARQAEVQAWEQEITPCEHTLCLIQDEARQIESQGTLTLQYCHWYADNYFRAWALFNV